jgi:hypothetical protein
MEDINTIYIESDLALYDILQVLLNRIKTIFSYEHSALSQFISGLNSTYAYTCTKHVTSV